MMEDSEPRYIVYGTQEEEPNLIVKVKVGIPLEETIKSMEYLINTWNKFLETNKNKGEQ
jgi:hypothetical protein